MKNLTSIEELKRPAESLPIILKIGQPGCMPCMITEDNLKSIESDYEDKAIFECCNSTDLALEYGLTHVPSVIIKSLHNEDVILEDNGVMMDEYELKSWIDEHLQ